LSNVMSEVIAVLRSNEHSEPRRLWEAGLRLFEKTRQSNFRQLLVPILARWLQEQWNEIIVKETFRLSRPAQTVPAIKASLAVNKNNEAFIASLLLVTAEAVGSPLSAEYEKFLQEIVSDVR
jgi:hypothetical protein